MADENVEVKFGADTEQLKTGANQAAEAVKKSVDGMKGAFAGLGDTFGKVNGVMAATAAILAGGAMFKAAVHESLQFTSEANKLAKALGITATEASTLNVALGDIYSDADTFVSAAGALTKQVRLNEESLAAMGVQVRDSSGQYRNMKDIMNSSLEVLRSYKEGTDRNLAAQTLFRGAAQDAIKLTKLNNEVLEEAKKKQEALGLVVGQENVAAAKAYKAAMNDVGDVMLGIKKAVGDAVMPVLTELGNWFTEIGPYAVTAMKGAIGGLIAVFWGLDVAVKVVWNTFKAVVQSITVGVAGLVTAFARLQNLDLEGAKNALKTSGESMNEIWSKATDNMVDAAGNAKDKITNLFAKPTAVAATKSEGRDFKDPKAGKQDKDMAAARYALAKAQEEAENVLLQDNLKRAQALYDDAYAKNLIDTKGFFDAKLSITLASMDKEAEMKRKEIAHAEEELAKSQKKGTPEGDKEALKFRAELVKLTTDLKVIEANRAEAAINTNQKMIDAEKKLADAKQAIVISSREKLLTAEVEADQIEADTKFNMGLITKKQLIEQEMQFEERKFQIAQQAAQDRLNLELNGPRDPVAIANLNAQIEDLATQHQLKMKQIIGQGIAEANAPWISVFKTMETSLQTVLTGILTRTMTLKQAMSSILSSIGQAIITELVTKPLAAKAVAWVREKLFGVSEVTKNAAVAGSGAVAAMAGIPIIGPALAAAAGPATFAAAMAFAPVAASAAGGFDIPAGMNPMTQLHQKEMVLPEKHADVIRAMAENNSGVKGDSFNIEIKAMDARGVKQFFDDHGKAIVQSLKNQTRNFAMG